MFEKIFNQIETKYEFSLKIIVTAFVLTMIALSLSQVFARKLFHTYIPHADQAVNMFVMYLAIFGAALATIKMKHIHFEVLSNFISDKYEFYLNLLVNIVSIIVLLYLYMAAIEYLEFQKKSIDEFLPGLPLRDIEWFILPGFLAIILSSVINFIRNILNIKNLRNAD
jgi:TRAP-type C4-dicarboxylate transport system permease small subunit